MRKPNKKSFNESFIDMYEKSGKNLTPLSSGDVYMYGMHVEVDPTYASIIADKQIRTKNLKDILKDQEKATVEFLKLSDLEEKPKVKSRPELKAMKLSEGKRLKESSVVTESFPYDHNTVDEFIDVHVPLEELGMMAWKWMSKDDLVDMLKANEWGLYWDDEDEDEEDYDEDEDLYESLSLNEDYSNFIGKPLKDFLRTIDHRTKVNIDYETNALSGHSGMSGLAHDVNWEVADRIIKDIKLGDDRYYKFKILTEASNDMSDIGVSKAEWKAWGNGGGNLDGLYRCKVVAADENDEPLYTKSTSKISIVDKEIEKLKAKPPKGTTQIYVVRSDGKEVYSEFRNEDGTWDLIEDNRVMLIPSEDRPSMLNKIIAELSAESPYFVGSLREIPRERGSRVGFDEREMGFNPDTDTFYLSSPNMDQIEWAKKVADHYNLKYSDVKKGEGGKYHIELYAPGLSKDSLLDD